MPRHPVPALADCLGTYISAYTIEISPCPFPVRTGCGRWDLLDDTLSELIDDCHPISEMDPTLHTWLNQYSLPYRVKVMAEVCG